MPGGGEPLAIERHVLAELRQRRGGRPRVDRPALVADVREALRAVDGDADRRVRRLRRSRHHRDLFDVPERPAVAEAVARPREADDLECLVEARAVLRDVDLEAVELTRDRAAADAELEASAGEDVCRRGLLGAAQRMLERQQGDRGADADALRPLRDERHHHERIGEQRERAAEVQLREPRHVETELFGERDELEHLGVTLGVRLSVRFRRLEENSELHRGISSQASSSSMAAPRRRIHSMKTFMPRSFDESSEPSAITEYMWQ